MSSEIRTKQPAVTSPSALRGRPSPSLHSICHRTVLLGSLVFLIGGVGGYVVAAKTLTVERSDARLANVRGGSQARPDPATLLQMDIAQANMTCAIGLPGVTAGDVAKGMTTIQGETRGSKHISVWRGKQGGQSIFLSGVTRKANQRKKGQRKTGLGSNSVL